MFRLAICVMGICVALAATPQNSVAQVQRNMFDAGNRQVSPYLVRPVSASQQVGQTEGYFNQGGSGGCSDCGGCCDSGAGCGAAQGCGGASRRGGGCGLANRRGAVDECGGGCGGGCGVGNRLGAMGDDSMIQRGVALVPSNILGRVLDRRFGSPCSKYRRVYMGGVSIHDYLSSAGGVNGNAPGGGGGGGSQLRGTFRDGFVAGTAAGRYFNANSRIEWESAWRNNSGDLLVDIPQNSYIPLDGHFNTYSTMFNVIRDFHIGQLFSNGQGASRCPLVFYAGGGIGFTKQDGGFSVNNVGFVQLTDWAFAYQALAGVTFWEGKRGKLFAEYRYLANTETDVKANGLAVDTFNYVANEIVFGITIVK